MSQEKQSNARVHEIPAEMKQVLARKKAPSVTPFQVPLFRLPMAVNPRTSAELHRGVRADQPLPDAALYDDLLRQAFLVGLGEGQVLHLLTEPARLRQRSFFQSLTHFPHVESKALPQNAGHRRVGIHGVDVAKGPQRPPKSQPVKARINSRNLPEVFRYRFLPGVSLPPRVHVIWIIQHILEESNRLQAYWGLRLCPTARSGSLDRLARIDCVDILAGVGERLRSVGICRLLRWRLPYRS